MKAALDLFRAIGSPNTDCRPDGSVLGGGPRQAYLFNSTIAGIDEADAILLIGSNPRLEAPVLNARLRKAWLRGARIASIGDATDLTYPVEAASFDTSVFDNAQKPMIIVGAAALAGDGGAGLLRKAGALAKRAGIVKDGWNGFNVLHTAAARVGGLDLGFLPGAGGKSARDMLKGGLKALLLLGVDEVDLPKDGVVIYVGTHGDRGAHRADIILPGAAYTEKDATWVNTEGRVQYGRRAVFPKGEAKEDWTILRALSAVMGQTLPYDSLQQLRAKMIADHPTFGHVDYAPGAADAAGFDPSLLGSDGATGEVRSALTDFYFTNPIARASKTMAECAKFKAGAAMKVAAE